MHDRHFVAILITILVSSTSLRAQSRADTVAIQTILDEEVRTWNLGDAEGYSRHFAQDGTFTNILGLFYTGYQNFLDRHRQIFNGFFKQSVIRQQTVSLRFVGDKVAVAETLTEISNISAGFPQGVTLDAQGRLHTRLLQVLSKESGSWKIISYHNTDIKPGIPVPAMK